MRIRVEAWSAFGHMQWAAVIAAESPHDTDEVVRLSGSYEEVDAPTYDDELWYLAEQLQSALEFRSLK